ncbi:MAG: DUF86 domain-containing protein [Burkholderiales bacterium]|nr:DUF86 domain-containing protein [Burkholderiales bacterium]
MVDRDLVLKKLAFIETCVQELRTLARLELLDRDVREERFVVHTLQVAVQAALDVASHVVSDLRLGEPETNRQLFELLRRAGWLPDRLAAAMRDIAGFRNVVVHGYEAVDLRIVRDIVEHRLGDLLDFVTAVRGRIGGD